MKNEDDDSLEVSGGCGQGGCITLVLGIILLWALIFGVTWQGKHYGLGRCSPHGGVEVHTGEAIDGGKP